MDESIVVDTPWLSDRLQDTDLAVIDVRPPQFYMQGHIPGAVNLPAFLLTGPGGGPPPADALGARLGALGCTHEHHIVAYDDGASPSAAVLFQLLRYYRHLRVSVLDGGITKWMHEGRPLQTSGVRHPPATYVPGAPDPSHWARADDVLEAIGDTSAVIVDVRSPAEYLGMQPTATRDGHIPGAINLEWSNNLTRTDADLYVLRADDELRELYNQAGVTPDKRAILYCASGQRTSETFMVLKKLGYPQVSVYLPGWQEWGNRPDLPIEEP